MEEPLPKGKGLGPAKPSPSRVDTLPDALTNKLVRAALAQGDVVGERYELVRLLGDGAMGQVFLARNTAINVEVAIKVLRQDLAANPEFRRRFQIEAQAIAAVDHPNVARFVDLILGDPTFLVMEYVRGESLASVLRKQRKLGPRRAVRLATRLCWGLDAVHEAGIVHRDLKPGNIVLSPSRESTEVPKIIDFGLAKLAHVATADGPLTRAGQIVGTPEYMAPEQIAAREVDGRADVYALGCVLYTMLTGRSPFGGSDDDVQTLYRQINESHAPASSLAQGLSDELDAVLARALAKEPEKRFQSMQELAHALEALPEAAEPRRTGLAAGTVTSPAQAGDAAARSASPVTPRPRRLWIAALVGTTLVGVALGALLFGRARGAAGGAAPGGALLMLTTSPPDAEIELDGKVLPERTPAALTGVAPGRHELKLRRDGHDEVQRSVELGAGARESLQVTMPPKSRTITVKTVPAGAQVYLDDVLVGSSTPTKITVQADDFYQLRVEQAGFQPVTRNLGPEDQVDELTLSMDVDRDPVGFVMVVSSSRGQVWIDGVDTGYTTPTVAIRVPVGEHTVEIRDSTGHSASARVNVVAGVTQQTQLNVQECK